MGLLLGVIGCEAHELLEGSPHHVPSPVEGFPHHVPTPTHRHARAPTAMRMARVIRHHGHHSYIVPILAHYSSAFLVIERFPNHVPAPPPQLQLPVRSTRQLKPYVEESE